MLSASILHLKKIYIVFLYLLLKLILSGLGIGCLQSIGWVLLNSVINISHVGVNNVCEKIYFTPRMIYLLYCVGVSKYTTLIYYVQCLRFSI